MSETTGVCAVQSRHQAAIAACFTWAMNDGSAISRRKGQLDPYHSNFLKLDLMLKIMPLSDMIFNMTPNFTELWWHESNFP